LSANRNLRNDPILQPSAGCLAASRAVGLLIRFAATAG
jgi:hypothetical protein